MLLMLFAVSSVISVISDKAAY